MRTAIIWVKIGYLAVLFPSFEWFRPGSNVPPAAISKAEVA
jgi:hypothetical protein